MNTRATATVRPIRLSFDISDVSVVKILRQILVMLLMLCSTANSQRRHVFAVDRTFTYRLPLIIAQGGQLVVLCRGYM